MGLTDDAIQEFETLIEQQGERTDFPEMAGPTSSSETSTFASAVPTTRARRGGGAPPCSRTTRGSPNASRPLRRQGIPRRIRRRGLHDRRLHQRPSHRPRDGAARRDGRGRVRDGRRPSAGEPQPPRRVHGARRHRRHPPGLPDASGRDAGLGRERPVRPGRRPGGDAGHGRGGAAPVRGCFRDPPRGRLQDPGPVGPQARVLLERWVLGPLGDALSGVVDLETDGAPTTTQARAGLNFVGGGATVRSTIGRRGGFWTSVRVTDTSLLNTLHRDTGEYPSAPRSLEGVTGATFRLRQGLELKAVALGEGDNAAREVNAIGWHGPFESRGQTALALARCGADSGRRRRAASHRLVDTARDRLRVRRSRSGAHRSTGRGANRRRPRRGREPTAPIRRRGRAPLRLRKRSGSPRASKSRRARPPRRSTAAATRARTRAPSSRPRSVRFPRSRS